jgi:hypothetical protein
MDKKGRMSGNTKAITIIGSILIIVVGILAFVHMSNINANTTASITDEQTAGTQTTTPSGQQVIVTQTNVGDTATADLQAYTGDWGKEGTATQVYPTWIVTDSSGQRITNAVVTNSSTTTVGQVLNAYITGSAYYGDPVRGMNVTNTEPTLQEHAYTMATASDLTISGFDKNDQPLTADDNANNTADYNGGNVGAADSEKYYFDLEEATANKNFNLFAQCTWYMGTAADDFVLNQPGWVDIGSEPKLLKKTTITMYNDSNASSTHDGFTHCYVRGTAASAGTAGAIQIGSVYVVPNPLMLHENDETGKMQYIFTSDSSTAPTANSGTNFGVVFMDGAYGTDGLSNPTFGFYMNDDTQDPGAVGMDENPDTTFNGLHTAVAVEAQ